MTIKQTQLHEKEILANKLQFNPTKAGLLSGGLGGFLGSILHFYVSTSYAGLVLSKHDLLWFLGLPSIITVTTLGAISGALCAYLISRYHRFESNAVKYIVVGIIFGLLISGIYFLLSQDTKLNLFLYHTNDHYYLNFLDEDRLNISPTQLYKIAFFPAGFIGGIVSGCLFWSLTEYKFESLHY